MQPETINQGSLAVRIIFSPQDFDLPPTGRRKLFLHVWCLFAPGRVPRSVLPRPVRRISLLCQIPENTTVMLALGPHFSHAHDVPVLASLLALRIQAVAAKTRLHVGYLVSQRAEIALQQHHDRLCSDPPLILMFHLL